MFLDFFFFCLNQATKMEEVRVHEYILALSRALKKKKKLFKIFPLHISRFNHTLFYQNW